MRRMYRGSYLEEVVLPSALLALLISAGIVFIAGAYGLQKVSAYPLWVLGIGIAVFLGTISAINESVKYFSPTAHMWIVMFAMSFGVCGTAVFWAMLRIYNERGYIGTIPSLLAIMALVHMWISVFVNDLKRTRESTKKLAKISDGDHRVAGQSRG